MHKYTITREQMRILWEFFQFEDQTPTRDGRPPFEYHEFMNPDFSGMDLSGMNLSGAIFISAELERVDLSGSVLMNTHFGASNMYEADFSGAVMENANFRRAKLVGAILHSVNARGADFVQADLTETLLTNSNLEYAKGMRAILHGANMRWTDFSHANFAGAFFQGANAGGAVFWCADLTGCVFFRANLSWDSHDLIAARLLRAALMHGAPKYAELAAGYILMNRGNCYRVLYKEFPPGLEEVRLWAAKTMLSWDIDNDIPSLAKTLLRRIVQEAEE